MGGVSSIQVCLGFLNFFNFAKPLSVYQTSISDTLHYLALAMEFIELAGIC